jgi:hypothetical protein
MSDHENANDAHQENEAKTEDPAAPMNVKVSYPFLVFMLHVETLNDRTC